MSIWLTLLAILPGLLIVLAIYRLDLHEKESKLFLSIAFLLGIGCCFPAMQLEVWGVEAGFEESKHFGKLFVFSYFVVGLSEELVKFLVLIIMAYVLKSFNEPMDGIVYAVMIGMGFATLENLIYANRFGMGTTVIRAFTAVPAHAIFAIFMGYYLGLAKFTKRNRTKNIALALAIPVFIHGTYDIFILQQYHDWIMLLATLTLIISGYFAYQIIIQHQNASPFIKLAAFPTPTDSPNEVKPAEDNEIMDAILAELNQEEE